MDLKIDLCMFITPLAVFSLLMWRLNGIEEGFMDFSDFIYGFVKLPTQISLTCYMNVSNFWYGFLKNFMGPRSDHSLPMSVTNWLTDWLTHWLTDWRPSWRLNELTFVDGIKYLSDVDIEMKLRFSCQQLKTSGKACKAGNSCNSCNSCQSWRQWIHS